jgi:hypothetical protein
MNSEVDIEWADHEFTHRYAPLHPALSDTNGDMLVQGNRLQFFVASFDVNLFQMHYRVHNWPPFESLPLGSLDRTSVNKRAFAEQLHHHTKMKFKGGRAFHMTKRNAGTLHHYDIYSMQAGVIALHGGCESITDFDVIGHVLATVSNAGGEDTEGEEGTGVVTTIRIFDLNRPNAPLASVQVRTAGAPTSVVLVECPDGGPYTTLLTDLQGVHMVGPHACI